MLFNAAKRLIKWEEFPNLFKFRKGSWKAGMNIRTFEKDHTTAGGGTTETLTGLIPAGILLLGIVAKVTKALSGSGVSSWSLGVTSDTDRFGTTLALTAGTAVNIAAYAADQAGSVYYRAATDVLLTAAGGNFAAGGIVKIVGFYLSFDALTTS